MKKRGMRMRTGRMFLAVFLLGTLLAVMSGCAGSQADESEGTSQKTITGVEDLSGAKIGVQLGTTGDIYVSDYEGDDAGTTVERYSKGADAVQALKSGKIDCVVIDEQPALQFVSENSDIYILDEEFTLEEYAFCLAKDNTELLNDINEALATLDADGTLDNIIKNYIGTEDEIGEYPYVSKDVERTNGTLIIGTNAEFPPYEYYENNEVTGIDIDIMRAVCDELGMELQIEDMAFDSIISALSSGKVDVGASGFSITEERKKNVNFTDTYITTKQVIIVRADEDTGVATSSFSEKLYDNFVKDNRYMYIVKGLENTLIITFFALILGLLLGFIIAIVRTSHDRNGSLPILNAIFKLYLAVMRGTPVMIQLLIIYYVILASVTNKIMVAAIAFGLNSAAYVAEIVRSGIMSIDIGQFEAGRSLGLNYTQTMISIILPQAIKNILPALLNEGISLLKETSISGYIGLQDLTKGGDIIRSNTYEAFLPLVAVALIYLALVMFMSFCVGKVERRLRNNER